MLIIKKNYYFKHLLKGRGQYFGYAFESLLRGTLGSNYQVVLSAQKAAVVYLSKVSVCQKKSTIRLRNLTIVTLLNHRSSCIKKLWSEGLGEYRTSNGFAGSMFGVLYMCTSRGCLPAAGEARKYSTTSSGVGSNESAPIRNTTIEIGSEWFINDNKLFERAVAVTALKRAWFQLKSKPSMSTRGFGEETLSAISDVWFTTTSRKLLEGSFKYPNRRRVLIGKADEGTRPLTIVNSRIKVIERAFLNAMEPQYEGLSEWEEITKSEYNKIKKNKSLRNSDYKKVEVKNTTTYFKKTVIIPCIFHHHNYGSRTKKSTHQALHHIKH